METAFFNLLLKFKNTLSSAIKKVVGDPRIRQEYIRRENLIKQLEHFKVRRLVFLVDEHTDPDQLSFDLPVEVMGVYSFSLDMLGEEINGRIIQPLLPDSIPVDTEGWLISAKNKFAIFSLNNYLLQHKKEDQVIIQHYLPEERTDYYSYIDFFTGEVSTSVLIHNYFERCYRIPFPLDIRFTLRDEKGEVVNSGQRVIPCNGITEISSGDFSILENFKGNLEIEFNVRCKVNSFLHYNAVYSSEKFITSNHQSGLGLHAAGNEYARGYIPPDPDEDLVVALFQKHDPVPLKTSARLIFWQNGKKEEKEKQLPSVNQYHIMHQGIKELFPEIDFSGVDAPYVQIYSDSKLYRPNFFYTRKGTSGYYDLNHSAPVYDVFSKPMESRRRRKMRVNDAYEWQFGALLFPEETGIDTLLGVWCQKDLYVKEFLFRFYDEKGKKLFVFEVTFDPRVATYININEFLKEKRITSFYGTVLLSPAGRNPMIPGDIYSNVGYIHRNNPYLTSTATAIGTNNLPFYTDRYPGTFLGTGALNTADVYCPGMSNEEYDTWLMIGASSAYQNFLGVFDYEITLYNYSGHSVRISGTINANGMKCLKLSELVKETGFYSEKGRYAVWFYSNKVLLMGNWVLVRKKDSAIAVEHCYAGKFGLL